MPTLVVTEANCFAGRRAEGRTPRPRATILAAMRVAIVADVHGNLVALEAVIADLAQIRPDVVVHGGDLAFNGPRPAECIDRVRELGWPGVMGNMDHALETHPAHPRTAWTRERIGDERHAWLQAHPMEWRWEDSIALVHAVPGDLWRAVPRNAGDAELRATYGPLRTRLAVYCHIHQAYVREMGDFTVANTGSVGLPFDGDVRSSYLLVSDGRPQHRRIAYDIERAAAEVEVSGMPGAQQVAEVYRTARSPV